MVQIRPEPHFKGADYGVQNAAWMFHSYGRFGKDNRANTQIDRTEILPASSVRP